MKRKRLNSQELAIVRGEETLDSLNPHGRTERIKRRGRKHRRNFKHPDHRAA